MKKYGGIRRNMGKYGKSVPLSDYPYTVRIILTPFGVSQSLNQSSMWTRRSTPFRVKMSFLMKKIQCQLSAKLCIFKLNKTGSLNKRRYIFVKMERLLRQFQHKIDFIPDFFMLFIYECTILPRVHNFADYQTISMSLEIKQTIHFIDYEFLD